MVSIYGFVLAFRLPMWRSIKFIHIWRRIPYGAWIRIRLEISCTRIIWYLLWIHANQAVK